MPTAYVPRRCYHRISHWRGYPIPACAILGSSDTGTAADSPAPTLEVVAELNTFRRDVLRPARIRSRVRVGVSSNVCCMKRWLTVSPADFDRAAALAAAWIEEHNDRLEYVHDADLHAALAPAAEGVAP